jgi:hypothetical protein
VIAAPPSEAGAAKERLMLASPAVAATADGTPGALVAGVAVAVELLSEPPQAARVAANSAVERCRRKVFMVVAEEAIGSGDLFRSRD